MPRRVYTYLPNMGFDGFNLLSSIGAFTIGAGVALFVFDMARKFRMTQEENAGNVYGGGTLEWLQNGSYAARSIPIVNSRDHLLYNPATGDPVQQGPGFLPAATTHPP